METMLADLGDEEWSAPSRCDGWSVQDVVAHLVGVNAFWRSSVTAGLNGSPTRVLAGFDPAATPPLMVEPMRALTPAAVLDQFVASNDAFLATISDLDAPAWTTLAETPPGHLPMHLLARHALWDAWIHERDIALPLGRTAAEEPDELRSCLGYAAALSPAFAISFGAPTLGAFAIETTDPVVRLVLEVGETVAVREGAAPTAAPCLRGDTVSLIEALSLRAPTSVSAPIEWRRLLEGLAMAFDGELELA